MENEDSTELQVDLPEKRKPDLKTIVLGAVIILLLVTNAITLKLYLDTFDVEENELIEDTGDELSRAKFFIKDWYDELSESYSDVKVFYNELQFEGGTYTITVASDRIRAVYPRGTRYFQLENVSYIEFFMNDGHLTCRMYYNETGELIFKLN